MRRFENDRSATFEVGAGTATWTRPIGPDSQRVLHPLARHPCRLHRHCRFPSTANIGDGRVWTASLVAGIQATSDLRLHGGFTWNESRLTTATSVLAACHRFPIIAGFTGRAGFDYARPISATLDLPAQGWVSYVGNRGWDRP